MQTGPSQDNRHRHWAADMCVHALHGLVLTGYTATRTCIHQKYMEVCECLPVPQPKHLFTKNAWRYVNAFLWCCFSVFSHRGQEQFKHSPRAMAHSFKVSLLNMRVETFRCNLPRGRYPPWRIIHPFRPHAFCHHDGIGLKLSKKIRSSVVINPSHPGHRFSPKHTGDNGHFSVW